MPVVDGYGGVGAGGAEDGVVTGLGDGAGYFHGGGDGAREALEGV